MSAIGSHLVRRGLEMSSQQYAAAKETNKSDNGSEPHVSGIAFFVLLATLLACVAVTFVVGSSYTLRKYATKQTVIC